MEPAASRIILYAARNPDDCADQVASYLATAEWAPLALALFAASDGQPGLLAWGWCEPYEPFAMTVVLVSMTGAPSAPPDTLSNAMMGAGRLHELLANPKVLKVMFSGAEARARLASLVEAEGRAPAAAVLDLSQAHAPLQARLGRPAPGRGPTRLNALLRDWLIRPVDSFEWEADAQRAARGDLWLRRPISPEMRDHASSVVVALTQLWSRVAAALGAVGGLDAFFADVGTRVTP